MTVAYRSGSGDDGAAGTTTNLTAVLKPAGVVDGDFLLASVAIVGGAAVIVTAPVGWALLRRTDIGTSYGQAIYYRFAQNEPGSWTWAYSTSAFHAVVVRAYQGVDSFFPVDAEAAQTSASTTTKTIPSVTTSLGGSVMAVSLVTSGAPSVTAPANYARRIRKSKNGASVETEDTQLGAAGPTTSADILLTQAQQGICHSLALRSSIGTTATVEQVRSAIKALFPPGADTLYDWDNSSDPSQLWLLTQGVAQFVKGYGYDWVDLLTQEVNPLLVVAKLPEWEGTLGVTQASASAVNKWIATRQQAVLSKLRESGASTLSAIRAVLEPLLGYSTANTGTLEIVEANRAAQTLKHTYANSSGAAIGIGGAVTQVVQVPDDGVVSAAGVQLRVTLTCTNPETLRFRLVGPTGSAGQADVVWLPGALPIGAATSSAFYLYEHATSAGKAIAAAVPPRSWSLTVTSSTAACTLVSWGLFVEGAGRDAAGRDGLGAGAIFQWAANPDPAKVNNPDYTAVRNAITRIQPAYTDGTLTLGGASAIPSLLLYPAFLPRAT